MATTRVVFDTFPERKTLLRAALPAELERAAAEIAELATAASRVGPSGEMSQGWQHRMESPTKAVVYNDVWYSLFHEYGTVRMAAQPMARPAAEQVFPSIVAALQGVLNKRGTA